MTASLAEILTRARAVLFDFDGPLCDVFAGLPASRIAGELNRLLAEPVETDDPMAVLQAAAVEGARTAAAVDKKLREAERAAIEVASENRDGLAALNACRRAGRLVGIVSNNDEIAIRAFMARSGIPDVKPVIGRADGRPDLMKPHPWSLRQALDRLGCVPSEAVFIGDSDTDIEVSQVVGVVCVALANKRGKRARFESAGAYVIHSMAEVTAALAEGA
jgi:phosphoglycolate phosphatase-like HAD superfamily hydrolase